MSTAIFNSDGHMSGRAARRDYFKKPVRTTPYLRALYYLIEHAGRP